MSLSNRHAPFDSASLRSGRTDLPRPPAPRTGRAQILTGVGLAVPSQPEGGRHLAAYVPVELELSLQVSGPLSVLLGGSGCGAVDRLLDCQKVCNKKKECINDSYDVNACVDYCRNRASNEEAYGQKLNDCSACFETRACVEAAALVFG